MKFSRYIFRMFPSSGDNEIRTRDPLLARQVLSHLSYTPMSVLSFSLALPKILSYLQNYIVLSASFFLQQLLLLLSYTP